MPATLTGQSGPIAKVWLTANAASPGNTPCRRAARARCRSGLSQLRPDLPEFGEQHHVQHLPQIENTRGAASAPLESDDPLDCRDVVEAPAAEIVLEIPQLFGQLIQFPVTCRFPVHR